jgi:hypothetical protein
VSKNNGYSSYPEGPVGLLSVEAVHYVLHVAVAALAGTCQSMIIVLEYDEKPAQSSV